MGRLSASVRDERVLWTRGSLSNGYMRVKPGGRNFTWDPEIYVEEGYVDCVLSSMGLLWEIRGCSFNWDFGRQKKVTGNGGFPSKRVTFFNRSLCLLRNSRDMKKEALQNVTSIHEGPSWGSWRGSPLTGNFGESETLFYQETLFITEAERFVKDVAGDGHLKP